MTNLKKSILALGVAVLSSFGAQAADVFMHTPMGFNVLSLSPNGKWACGVYIDVMVTAYGFRWNLESGEIEMLDANPNVAWDIANDGTISGDFLAVGYLPNQVAISLPGMWNAGAWHVLEMPNKNVTGGMGCTISPDGRYMTASLEQNSVYKSYIWEDGKVLKALPSDSHAVAYAVAPDGQAAAGYSTVYNRVACYWKPTGDVEFFTDSPTHYRGPYNYSRNFSPDGTKLVYWGGWEYEEESGDLYLYCLYDVLTGEHIRVKAESIDSTLEFFDVSNNGTMVGGDFGRGYVMEGLQGKYIDEYLEDKGCDISKFDDFYTGSEGYTDCLPIDRILAISEDENVLAATYYNKDGQLASIIIKMNQDITTLAPANVKGEQLPGLNSAAITWKSPVGIAGLAGYNVYRDGKKLNMLPLTLESYYDKNLAEGTYQYEISCVTSAGNENKAEAITVTIDKQPMPQPLSIYARQKGVNSAQVSWEAPLSPLTHRRYYNPEAFDLNGFYVYEATEVETAIRYNRAELDCYSGFKLQEVSFVPLAEQDSWKINIYSRASNGDLSLIYTQPVTQTLEYGKINNVALTTPMDLPASDMIVAICCKVRDDAPQFIGAEAGRTVPGYSDLLRRLSDENFISAYESSVESGYTVSTLAWAIDLGLKRNDAEVATLSHYNVYADAVKCDDTTSCSYLLGDLADGNHTLGIEAVYSDGTVSEMVSTDVDITANYPKVDNVKLAHANEGNTEVLATWETPADCDYTPVTYTDATTPGQGIKGLASTGYAFMAAVDYPPAMIRGYEGYKIESFEFYPLCDAMFTFMLYENDRKIAEVEPTDLTFNKWNKVDLTTNLTINENATYRLVLDIFDPVPDTPVLPLDGGRARDGFSDLYSINNGEYWASMTTETGSKGSWMMRMNITDTTGAPLNVDGYDVVIDGEKKNDSALTDTKFAYDFGVMDTKVHSLRVDTYYPARALAVEGGATHFLLSTLGIEEARVGTSIEMQCGPNYIEVKGEGVKGIQLIDTAGRIVASCNGNLLEITGTPAGIYIAKVNVLGSTVVRKLSIK